MGKRLYVGNLEYQTTEASLSTLFGQHGTVVSTTIIEGKGFGFVEMETEEEAAAAKQGLNEVELDGRSLRVDEAKPRPERSGDGYRNDRRDRW